jgi:hypothetical protein
MEENSPLTMELRSLNLYGALESYEKSVRERKFLIAKTEDKITRKYRFSREISHKLPMFPLRFPFLWLVLY